MIIEIEYTEIEKIIEIEKKSFSSPWNLENYQNLLKNYQSKIFVYILDSDIVAYSVFLDMVDIYELVKIAVKQEYRSQNIATKFLGEIVDRLEKGIFLEVRESNEHAISLYKKIGFETMGVRKKYYKDTGENAIIMSYNK